MDATTSLLLLLHVLWLLLVWYTERCCCGRRYQTLINPRTRTLRNDRCTSDLLQMRAKFVEALTLPLTSRAVVSQHARVLVPQVLLHVDGVRCAVTAVWTHVRKATLMAEPMITKSGRAFNVL